MVQTLAALLSWIAMLAVISIAVMVSGVWRPRAPTAAAAAADLGRHPAHRLRSAAQVNAQAEAIALAQAQARVEAKSRSVAQRQRQRG